MINTVSEINRRLADNPETFIQECDNEYRLKIKSVAAYVCNNKKIRLVSIAGPSGAGKTTTANLLRAMLAESGIETYVISLDNFYFSRDIVDVGKVDPESVEALDVELLKECLFSLLEKGTANLPVYDFAQGLSLRDAEKVTLSENSIIILEGIHGLNPVITDALPSEKLLKLYISAYTPFVDETENVVITGRKLRLMRRALRDKRFRGSDINRTLSFWDGVIKAEDKFLYGFIKYANFHIHTMHAFEPALYRNEFIEMTKEVSEDHPFYDYLKQICKGLEEFTTISSEFIPQNSLIREFIGQD